LDLANLLTAPLFIATFLTDMNAPITILLADDHAVVRAGIRQFLETASDLRVVAEAGDGDEARRLIAAHRPDVAVLDIQMPKATGIEVARWTRQEFPATGVLILTAYDDDPYIRAGLAAGANGYVLKTAAPAAMIQAVRDVYEGKQVLDPAIRARAVAFDTVFEPLSERELEVLALAARGYTNKAISAQLFISDRTVQGHLAHIYAKLQTNTRTEAVMRAVSLGLIAP
jgi:DNA-binding NarL/FixJ family response regulator